MKALISVPQGAVFDTFFPPENIALAESLGECVWNTETTPMTTAEVAEKIGDCDVYVTLWGSPAVDREILDNAPNLRLVTHLGGTVVPFVSDAFWASGIPIISGNAYFAESVAEGTLAYMLAGLREIPKYNAQMKEAHQWKTAEDRNAGLAGKTIGLVSYGTIARNVVRLLSMFRVQLKVYDIAPLPPEDVERYGLQTASLEEIFSTCDIISLHTPLLEQTHHLIDRNLLQKIKPGALFINTSRGAIVDQAALEDELATGRFCAVLDVFEKEPLPPESRLRELPNTILIPHMAGPTVDLRSFITKELLLETAAYLNEGKPLVHAISQKVASTMSKH